MKNLFAFLCVIGLLCPGVSFSADPPSFSGRTPRADVVLDAIPIRVKSLKEKKGVDALERLPEEMGPSARIVVFRIHRVLHGELRAIQTNDPSLWDQAKEAADDKNILKLITMDFKRPEKESPKEWLTVLVADPYVSFGIKEGASSPQQRYRISLARIHKNPDSYLLVKSEKC